MCGRYSITTSVETLQTAFGVSERPNLAPRYNVAPTQEAPVVRLGGDGQRHLVTMRWGLVPFWAEDAAIGNRLINARAETAATKPAFRHAFAKRRCLVIADSFYEWQKPSNAGQPKQPYQIMRRDGGPFAFAGLWETWAGPGQEALLESFTILTTEANSILASIHARMPVILHPADYDAWLDFDRDPDRLSLLLRPDSSDDLMVRPISTRINNVHHDGSDAVVPLETVAEKSTPKPVQGRLL